MTRCTAIFVALVLAAASTSCEATAVSRCAVKSSVPSSASSTDASAANESLEMDESIGTDGPSSENSTAGSSDGSLSSSGSSAMKIVIDPNVKGTDTYESTYHNWVGSAIGDASDTACYREAHIASTCPQGFDSTLGTCWAECPIAYPVECGMECIRQNDDCGLEVVYKATTTAIAAFSTATLGVFSKFSVAAKAAKQGMKCAKEMIGLVKSLTRYIRNVKVTNPDTTQEKLLAILYQTNHVVVDIPVAVCTCLGIPVPANAEYVGGVLIAAEYTLMAIMEDPETILESWDAFKTFLTTGNMSESLAGLESTEISSLEDALASNTTCGYDMKALTDRTWMKVQELREATPDISKDDMRVAMSTSDLVLNEIPIVTNNCMEELIAVSDTVETAYGTRDTLRKTFGVIVDDLVDKGTSDNGTSLSSEEFAQTASELGLLAFSIVDPTGIALLVAEFLQTICGPTEMIGEIDDGSAADALGLSIVGDAFNGSTGTWTKVGDGSVTFTFESIDLEDVTVNIYSGGDEFADVDLEAGTTATWTSTVAELQDKTLYLDRTRPGLLGLPGKGGGSMLLWAPRSSQGGNLQMHVILNES